MRVLVILASLAAPALAFLPTPSVRAPRAVAAAKPSAIALKAAHVQAGSDYYPGKVDYGNSNIDIIDTLKKNGQFNTLLHALEVAGLTDVLRKDGGIYTCYFPTDAAFAKIPKAELDALLANKPKLQDLLKYHVHKLVVKDKEGIRAFRLSNKPSLQGGRVKINVRANPAGGEQLVIFNSGEAQAVETDIDTINGTIHAIDGVLTPQAGTTIPLK